jgi:hypothetical protein
MPPEDGGAISDAAYECEPPAIIASTIAACGNANFRTTVSCFEHAFMLES